MSGYSVVPAGEAFWQPSKATGVLNAQLASGALASRLWRLRPGQFNPRHAHAIEHELYVVLEGTGRMRIGEDSLSLDRLSAVLVEPLTARQLFNDGDEDVLWLVVGAPPEAAATYPDGALDTPPPELS